MERLNIRVYASACNFCPARSSGRDSPGAGLNVIVSQRQRPLPRHWQWQGSVVKARRVRRKGRRGETRWGLYRACPATTTGTRAGVETPHTRISVRSLTRAEHAIFSLRDDRGLQEMPA